MALYHYGRSRPPRTPRRRRLWAWAVLVFSVPMGVLFAIGAIQGWADGDMGAAATFTVATLCCGIGVGAGIWALLDDRRRPADQVGSGRRPPG